MNGTDGSLQYRNCRLKMKTHMNNTQSMKLHNDIVGHTQFLNHQRALHSDVKPRVSTTRKEQIKISRNNKVELNTNPKQHINKLYSNLYNQSYKSGIDNKQTNYDQTKELLANKIKRNKYEQLAQKEHERELQVLDGRIKNCKNLQQRKKDNTDPIVNPTYFIKQGKEIEDVTINGYCKKVLGMNRSQSGFVQEGDRYHMQQSEAKIQTKEMPISQSFGSVPNYSKARPQSANPHMPKVSKAVTSEDLPGCSFKEILHHIVNNKLFKDVQMKVLYVRLCHRYGEQAVDEIWQNLMDELER